MDSRKELFNPLEHDEQVMFFKMAQVQLSPEDYILLWATPNCAKRSPQLANYMLSEGLKSGVPDIMFASPSGEYHGLFIEMKRRHGSRVSPEQAVILDRLNQVGYKAVVCHGCDEAISELMSYIGRRTDGSAKQRASSS